MTNYCHLPLHDLKKIDLAISPKLIFLRIFTVYGFIFLLNIYES